MSELRRKPRTLTTTFQTGKGPLKVTVKEWLHGMPYPKWGRRIASDNETELFSVTVPVPPLVVSGYYNADESTVYIVEACDVEEFNEELLNQKDNLGGPACTRAYFFNAPYDIMTSGAKMVGVGKFTGLLEMLNQDRLMDVKLNLYLHWFATRGDVRYDCSTLADCAEKLCGMHLDKGDGSEDSDRMSFKQGQIITDSQMIYLAGDCVSTYLVGEYLAPQPTVFLQTKADLVLQTMSDNGVLIDRDVWKYYTMLLEKAKEEQADKLRTFGFPIKGDKVEGYKEHLDAAFKARGMNVDQSNLNKDAIRKIIEHEWKNVGGDKLKDLLEAADVVAYDKSTKKAPINEMAAAVLTCGAKSKEEMVSFLKEWGENNCSFLEKPKTVGPLAYMDGVVKDLFAKYPKLQLKLSPKTGKPKLGKTEQWRLEDAGVDSPFLNAYIEYKHAEKLLTTYMKESFICPDGKIHANYKPMVRTGRTACGGNYKKVPQPNCQNLPSRDATYKLKNPYCAPPDCVLCAVDYTGAELVSLAQTCYTKYGYSRMRDILNADVNIHTWVGAIIAGAEDPELFSLDPVELDALKKRLEPFDHSPERQLAKVLDFGCPGALGPGTLYQQIREAGIKVSPEHAAVLLEKWKAMFPEMKCHMRRQKMSLDDIKRYKGLVIRKDSNEEEEDEVEEDKMVYTTTILSGRTRSRCSYNASANFEST